MQNKLEYQRTTVSQITYLRRHMREYTYTLIEDLFRATIKNRGKTAAIRYPTQPSCTYINKETRYINTM
jgi:hypothetical protein